MRQYNKEVFEFIHKKSLSGLKKFIKDHSSLDIMQSKLKVHTDKFETPITAAIQVRDLEMVKFLHSIGCSLSNESPLQLAVLKGETEIVNYLIDNQAPYEKLLSLTIREDMFDMFTHLLGKGIQEEGLLDSSIVLDRHNFTYYLLTNQYSSINELNVRGESMLTVAIAQDNMEAAKMLLEFGIDPNNIDSKLQHNPWHKGTWQKYLELKTLYEEKALLENNMKVMTSTNKIKI